MDRQFAEKMRAGQVRVGSFADYRRDEHHDAIRDDLEGQTVGQVGDVILTTDAAEPVVTTVAGLKFAVASGGVIDIRGTKYVRELPSLYVYSTSAVSASGHLSSSDTVVEITDIERFGRLLVDGRPDLFIGYDSGWVRYEPRVYDAIDHPGLEPNPFVKHSSFEADEEFRLVLYPRGSVEPHVIVELPSVAQAFADGVCTILR